jgi:ketosteroid isomerase-like protein
MRTRREASVTDAGAVTLQLLDAWNARDLIRYVGMLAEDVEWYDPAMPQPPARGRGRTGTLDTAQRSKSSGVAASRATAANGPEQSIIE